MITTLQQRLVLFLLLPVAVLLLALGLFGFFSMRDSLLQAWEEAAILKLERAAHTIDMRLSRVKSWIQQFHNTAQAQEWYVFQPWLLQQLENEEGGEQGYLDLVTGSTIFLEPFTRSDREWFAQ